MEARPGRQDSRERTVVRRIQRERERKGMSYEALAKAVTQAGCRMHPSTPFKIEKGDPPRRITIDEFVAFAHVFGLRLDQLLVPPEFDDEKVVALMEQYQTLIREGDAPVKELTATFDELCERLGGVTAALTALSVYSEETALGRGLPGLARLTDERGGHG